MLVLSCLGAVARRAEVPGAGPGFSFHHSHHNTKNTIFSQLYYRASVRWLAELRSWVPGGFSLSTMPTEQQRHEEVAGGGRVGDSAENPNQSAPPPGVFRGRI